MRSLWYRHHLSWQGSQSRGGKVGSSAANGKSPRFVNCISHRSIFGHILRIFKTCICTQASSSAACTRFATSPINHWQQLLSRAQGYVLSCSRPSAAAERLHSWLWQPPGMLSCRPKRHKFSFQVLFIVFAALMKKWYRFSVVFPNPIIPTDPARFYERQDIAETRK